MRTRKNFTPEFKLEAVRLLKEADKPAAQIALELGIRRNQLYKWRDQLEKTGRVASAQLGRPKKSEQSEAAKLREENRKLKEENEILKKAKAYLCPLRTLRANSSEVRICGRTCPPILSEGALSAP